MQNENKNNSTKEIKIFKPVKNEINKGEWGDLGSIDDKTIINVVGKIDNKDFKAEINIKDEEKSGNLYFRIDNEGKAHYCIKEECPVENELSKEVELIQASDFTLMFYELKEIRKEIENLRKSLGTIKEDHKDKDKEKKKKKKKDDEKNDYQGDNNTQQQIYDDERSNNLDELFNRKFNELFYELGKFYNQNLDNLKKTIIENKTDVEEFKQEVINKTANLIENKFNEIISNKIANLENKIIENKIDTKQLKQELSFESVIESKLNEFNRKFEEINTLKNEINNYKGEILGKLDTITSNVQNELNHKISVLENELKNKNKNIEELQKELQDKLDEKNREIENLKNKLKIEENKWKTQVDKLNEEKTKVEEDKKRVENNLEEIKKQLEKQKQELGKEKGLFGELKEFYEKNKDKIADNKQISNIKAYLSDVQTFIQYFGNYRLLEENYEILRSIAKSSDKKIDELSMKIYDYQLKYVLLPSTENQRVEVIKPGIGDKYEKNKHDAGNQPSSTGEVVELLLPGFINPATGEIKKAVIKIKN